MNTRAPIHIVHVVESLDTQYGGPAQSVPLLARESHRLGAVISFISANWTRQVQENAIIEHMDASWVRLTRLGPDKLRYSPKLLKSLRRVASPPRTIMHVHNLWNYVPFAAYHIAKLQGIPLVVSLRGTMSDWAWSQNSLAKQVAWRLFQKAMLDSASAIHATSVEEADSVQARRVTSPVHLIPNGIDLAEFSRLSTRCDAKLKLGLDARKRHLLFLSRLHPKKGIEKLVDAWSMLHASVRRQWQLLIVGESKDPHYRLSLQKRVEAKRVSESISFLGHLPGAQRLEAYAAAEAFVLPSYSENFGIVVLEALAAGLPIITTTGTPWREVEERGAGYYIEARRDALLNAMLSIMINDDLRERMSIEARVIAQRYSWKRIGESFDALYKFVLTGSRKENIRPDSIYRGN